MLPKRVLRYTSQLVTFIAFLCQLSRQFFCLFCRFSLSTSLVHQHLLDCWLLKGVSIVAPASLRSVQQQKSQPLPIIRRACGSLRAAAHFIDCLRSTLAIKSVTLCSPLCYLHMLQTALIGLKFAPPLLHSQAARVACLLPITLRSTVSSQPFSRRRFFPVYTQTSPQLKD